jgi:hypothetical protein
MQTKKREIKPRCRTPYFYGLCGNFKYFPISANAESFVNSFMGCSCMIKRHKRKMLARPTPSVAPTLA